MPGETETDTQMARRDRWAAAGETNGAAVQGDDGSASPLDKALKRVEEQDASESHSYYDLSLLKPPVWTPEVAAYFFLGGLAAGAYMLGRVGERFGGEKYRAITTAGTWVALAAALPCAPLLIMDLGDPKRFHHMLRIFKPQSPMNVGSWALTAFSGAAMLAALREWWRSRPKSALPGRVDRFLDDLLTGVSDLVGLPAGLVLAGYTGVLLSTTSTPVWSKNPWLGALFTSGGLSTGCAAVRLALEGLKPSGDGEPDESRDEPLRRFSTAAHAAEAATMFGYLMSAGRLARPLLTGPQAGEFLGGGLVAGLVVPEIVERLPAPRSAKRWLGMVGMAAALIGGFFLRHSFVEAGKTSANDPDDARYSSRAR